MKTFARRIGLAVAVLGLVVGAAVPSPAAITYDFEGQTATASSGLMVGAVVPLQEETTITFEGFAPPGGLVNINPQRPYREAGFTFRPTNAASAVFDAAAATSMIGNRSDFFGFAESNPITLINDAGLPFDLRFLLVGPSTVAQGRPVSVTLVGTLAAGGTVSITLPDLTTATLVTPDFTNVVEVVFRATDDAGLDNISLSVIPEPSTLAAGLLGVGLMGGAWLRRRRRQAA